VQQTHNSGRSPRFSEWAVFCSFIDGTRWVIIGDACCRAGSAFRIRLRGRSCCARIPCALPRNCIGATQWRRIWRFRRTSFVSAHYEQGVSVSSSLWLLFPSIILANALFLMSQLQGTAPAPKEAFSSRLLKPYRVVFRKSPVVSLRAVAACLFAPNHDRRHDLGISGLQKAIPLSYHNLWSPFSRIPSDGLSLPVLCWLSDRVGRRKQ